MKSMLIENVPKKNNESTERIAQFPLIKIGVSWGNLYEQE